MLVCEETKKLKTVTADLPELPQGGLMVKVVFIYFFHLYTTFTIYTSVELKGGLDWEIYIHI